MYEIESFGLSDPDVLGVAMQLSPELFAGLAIAHRLDDARFPLTRDADLEAVIREVGDEEGTYAVPGVQIQPVDAKDRFPSEFLPVVDRLDLIRKVYMAIVIAHQSESRARLDELRSEGKVQASHPFDLEVL